MGIDWEEVEELVKPSPNYQTLIKRLQEVLSYEFVKKHYGHNMKDASEYATKLLGGDPRQRYGEYLERLKVTFGQLDRLGIKNYQEFIDLIDKKEKLEKFYDKTGLAIYEIVRVLHYLLNWVLPTRKYLRELIEKENQTAMQDVVCLRENGIRFTLDILENGRTKQGREEIARVTGIPEDRVFEYANRADFTRMPYVSGSTVRHYFNGGCDSIEKLASANLTTLAEDMDRYFNEIGKNRKRTLELDSGIVNAKALPKLIEH